MWDERRFLNLETFSGLSSLLLASCFGSGGDGFASADGGGFGASGAGGLVLKDVDKRRD